MAGETTAIGPKPAWGSWTKPGSVASSERVAPPGTGADSSTVTSSPARARWIAATSPLCPEPTTRTRVGAIRRALPRPGAAQHARIVGSADGDLVGVQPLQQRLRVA